MRTKDVVFIGTMAAVMVSVQVALSFLPNIELISLIVILCALIYGWRTLFIIYIFVLAEGLLYGFGLWWINYLYVWTVLMLLAIMLKSNDASFFWAVISGMFGLGFGVLCSIPYLFIGGPKMALASWTSGILFDIIHCIGNFTVALALYRPLRHILNMVNQKWNLARI